MAIGSATPPQLQLSPVLDSFDRHGILDNTRIVSRCKSCGTAIVSSVSNGIAEKERDHLFFCLLNRASSSASS